MLLFFLACWLMELVYGQGQCNNKDLLKCATFLGSKRFTELCKHGKIQDVFTDKNDSKTLLLPSRVALDAIPPHIVEELNRNKTFLNETLFHHLVPEQIMCNDLSDNSLVVTKQGARVRFNTYRSDKNETMITVDGGEFENVMDVTKSGLICVIDKFLYEIPVMTAYTFLTDNRNHSTFLLLAAKAEILDTFKDPTITLLLPDNAAFDKLPPDVLQNITSNVELIKKVIFNHFIDSIMFLEGLVFTEKFTASSGLAFPVQRKEREVTIGPARLVRGDITTLNGVVHVIDTVLIDTK